MKTLEEKIISMEQVALDRWNNGDPSGFLEISADDVVYFDTVTEQRIDGLENLTKYYESIRGKVSVDKDVLVNPKVQAVENMAVLTFNLVSHSNGKQTKWNCTEVYRREIDGNWKIISTHWSLIRPNL
jgi:ketosteroid isomerase-like protein